MVNLTHMKEWDKLTPSLREKFRNADVDFYFELWFQAKCLTDSDDEAFRMYEKYYWRL